MLLGSAQRLKAQWSTNGTNVYYNGGNVGIGTASPTNAKVEIKLGTGPSDASMYGLAFSTTAANFPTKGRIASSFDGLYITQNAYYNGSVWAVDDTSRSTAKIVLSSYVSGESSIMFATAAANNVPDPPVRMTIDKNGNLGIGTTSPTNPFTLNKPGASIIGNWYNLGAFIEPTNNKGIHLGYDNSSQTGLIISGSNGPASNLAFWTFNGSAWGERMRLDSSGNVGIGTSSPQYKLDVAGNINSNATITGNNIVAKYQDVAEWVPASEQLPAGTVVVLDTTKSNQVISSTQSYDPRVAGVISEQPGIALGEGGKDKVLVATTGRVLVKVDASRAAVHIGDLLVTSNVPGAAMKSEPINIGGVQLHRPGTLIGKALEPLEKGSGKILVLLSLQ